MLHKVVAWLSLIKLHLYGLISKRMLALATAEVKGGRGGGECRESAMQYGEGRKGRDIPVWDS